MYWNLSLSFASIRLSEKYYARLPLVDTKRANQDSFV